MTGALMVQKVTAGILGGICLLNGLFMLFDPEGWFATAAATTGPFNSHFVADVAVAFIASGLALLAKAWRAQLWPAAVAGCGFLVFHALIHVVEYVSHPHDARSMIVIAALAAAAVWSSLPIEGEQRC